MGDFDAAFRWILKAEGVESYDPDGGRTRYGIAQRFHPSVDLDNLTLDGAKAIYLAEYWAPIRGDELPAALAIAVFDGAVQHGPDDSVRFLQRALGHLTLDGVCGPKTIARAQAAADIPEVLAEYHAFRAAYYADQVALVPRKRKEFHGWLCRLFRLRAWLLTEAPKEDR